MARFQFSMRTLFIVVTLLTIPCAYVGYQNKIVAERKSMQTKIEELGGNTFWIDVVFYPGTLPVIRRWLGDEPICIVMVPESVQPSFVEEIKRVFPEASIERN